MKKLIQILLVSCLIMIAAGCSSSETKTTDSKFNDVTDTHSSKNDEYVKAYGGSFYYDQLTDNQKKIYDTVLDAAKNFEDVVYIKTTEVYDVARAIYAFEYENPIYFWATPNLQYHTLDGVIVDLMFTYEKTSDADLKEAYDYIDNYADELVKKVEGYSGVEQLLQLQKLICEQTEYSVEADYQQDIRSIVYTDNAACKGYTKLFQLCAQKLGYKCYEVDGEANTGSKNETHAWNIILFEGSFYWIDVTWDDVDNENKVVDEYFMLNDSHFLNTHFPEDSSFNYPECID